jgi:hypothetical protein
MGARSSAIQLGRTWTLLIVAQVAFTVAVLPAAVFVVWDGSRHAVAEPGFASAEFLTAQLGMDGDTPAIAPAEADRRDLASRLRTRHAELMTSLETQPDVSGATFAFAVPASEPTVRIEIDGLPAPAESPSGHAARPNAVDVGFFDVLDVATLAGRRLHSGDLGAPVIVVNRTFAQRILRGGNALGRRIRYTAGYRSGGVMRVPPGAALERWYEIVGVVDDLPAHPLWSAETEARSYHPLAPGQISPATLIVRWHRGAAASVAGRLREIAAALDPTLRLNAIRFLDEIYRQERLARLVPVMGLGLVTLCVLLLSSAGIYALMSFAPAGGARSGSGPRWAPTRAGFCPTFSRGRSHSLRSGPSWAVAVAAPVLAQEGLTEGPLMALERTVLLLAVSALIVAVGLLAAVGPARLGLRIQPTEALRAE